MQMSQRFEVDSTLDDCALASGAPNRAQDCQWRTRSNAARAGNDDDRDRRAEVVRDQEGKHSCA